MPSASFPALSRVASPNRTHVLCCCSRWGWGSGGEGEGAECNRLMTSIGELTLGPLPCLLCPGGDIFRA